jgi:hypothetical protein
MELINCKDSEIILPYSSWNMNSKGTHFNKYLHLCQFCIQLAVIEKINYIIITLWSNILDWCGSKLNLTDTV